MLIAFAISNQFSAGTLCIYLGLILLFNLRQKHGKDIEITVSFFLVYYLLTNLLLNLFDLVWNFMIMGISYRHDDDFVSSFSYKTH